MLILGIDPGSAITGYAIVRKNTRGENPFEVLDFGCIDAQKITTDSQRLLKMYKEMTSIIKKYKPNMVSVEKLFFFKNLKTVMPVSQTRGIILLAAAAANIPILEFTPLQVKIGITGYGRAEKKQVQKMLEQMVNLEHFNLKEKMRKKDDAFDAIAVAICAGMKSY